MRERIAIDALHPTQLTLGFQEVRRRKREVGAFGPKELQAYLEDKAVPTVRGPGGRRYMTDHHHHCRVLYELGHSQAVLDREIADWSDLPLRGFWERMHEHGLVWARDVDGYSAPYAAIPDHVRDLTDNPWRSLARELRDIAFDDLDTPFQEFAWGDYFRTFMTRKLLTWDMEAARELATGLARLNDACYLPGWRGDAASGSRRVAKRPRTRVKPPRASA